MNKQFELVEQIYKDASMGKYSTHQLLNAIEKKDNKISDLVQDILEEYSSFCEKAKETLLSNDIELQDESVMVKMMSTMGIYKEVLSDNSDSAISEMLIQGLSMGILEMEKRIKNVVDGVDKKYVKFAKDFLKFQKERKKDLEKYL